MSVPSSASSSLLSAHRDVLEAAIPECADAKIRLVEEIKNRGRGAVLAKAWRDAELLYSRGIEIQPDDAVLYANLSLVQLNMGYYEQARQSALHATIQDPAYLKGFWRLGQALTKLGQLSDALEAMETALQLEPDNKALLKEVTKLKTQVKEEKDLMDVDMPIRTKTTTTTTTTTTAAPVKTTSTVTSTTTAPVQTTTPTTTKVELDDDDDTDKNIFTKSDHVKGYKVVNGKKTSYFHRELSKAEKEMIGDIAPKRLEQETTTTTTSTPSVQEDGSSAWNKAGTWEERDVTTWAKETLTASLLTTSYVLPESCSSFPGATVRVSSVTKCDGHASFATVRGKKRYIYEFSLTLEWTFTNNGTTHVVKGKMTFPDFDGTCELGEGYEMIQYQVDDNENTTTSCLKPVLDQFVKHGGLRDAIHECLDNWVRLFRATY